MYAAVVQGARCIGFVLLDVARANEQTFVSAAHHFRNLDLAGAVTYSYEPPALQRAASANSATYFMAVTVRPIVSRN